jgi:hypothetical protein
MWAATGGGGAAVERSPEEGAFSFLAFLDVERRRRRAILLPIAERASPTSRSVPRIETVRKPAVTVGEIDTLADEMSWICLRPDPARPTTCPAMSSGMNMDRVVFSWATLAIALSRVVERIWIGTGTPVEGVVVGALAFPFPFVGLAGLGFAAAAGEEEGALAVEGVGLDSKAVRR